MTDFSNRGAGKGPALETGNIYATTSKRNPGRPAGKGPALEVGSDVKFAANDEGTGVLSEMPLGKNRFVSLPAVVDPSGSSQNPETSGTKEVGGVSPGRKK